MRTSSGILLRVSIALFLAAAVGIRECRAQGPEPPATAPRPKTLQINLYVQRTQTWENDRFPLIMEVVNATGQPVDVYDGIAPDIRSTDKQDPNNNPPPPETDSVVAVIHVRYPFTIKHGVGRITGRQLYWRLSQASGNVTINPRDAITAHIDLPVNLMTPGDNTIELTLEKQGKVIASSGVMRIHYDVPASGESQTEKH